MNAEPARLFDVKAGVAPAARQTVQPLRTLPQTSPTRIGAPREAVSPLERRRLRIYIIEMIADIWIIASCFSLVSLIYLGQVNNPTAILPMQLLLPIFLTISLYNGTYSIPSLSDWKRAAARVASAVLVAAALLNFLAFFVRMNTEFSRVVFTAGMVGSILLLVGFRYLVSRWIATRWDERAMKRLVIHAGGPDFDLPNSVQIRSEEQGLAPAIGDPDALDRLGRFVCDADQVIVSCRPADRIVWAEALKSAGVHGEVVSDTAHSIGAIGVVRREEAGISTLLVSRGTLGIRAQATKRAFDIVFASLALVLATPLLLLAALAILIEDGRPVVFKQRRIGSGNRFFQILKLRTMRKEREDADGDRSTERGDSRVTRVGRTLRRSSIDELPQLINVLAGEMSLVGPRPHALRSQAGDKLFWDVDQRYWQRHALRPGMTGLAQVRGLRGATDTESDLSNRLQSDLEYMHGWTLWRDVVILLRTIWEVLRARAY